MDQFPPGKHLVVILGLPVANSWPVGHVNVTTVPKAVSLLEAMALSPGLSGGQSEEINNNSFSIIYYNKRLRSVVITWL